MNCTATIPGGVLLNGGANGTTFWVSWQANGTLSSGPFAVPVSILGQRGKPGANARQFVNIDSAWSVISDEGAPPGYDAPALQDVAFTLNGNQKESMGAGSYSIITGEEFAGTLGSLSLSDDDYVSLFNDPTSLQAVIEIVSAPTNNTSPSKTTVTFEHGTERGGLSFTAKLWNKNTSQFDAVFGSTAPVSDVTNSTISTTTNYVSNAGTITLRLEWAPVNDEDPSQDGWLHRVDRTLFETEP